MDNQQPDDLEIQVNNAGKRVFQMRREGRDLEYMVNQLEYEGFDHSVVKRILFAVRDQEVIETKQIDSSKGNYYLIRGGITLVIGIVIMFIPAIFGLGGVYFVLPIGAILVGCIFILIGILKKTGTI